MPRRKDTPASLFIELIRNLITPAILAFLALRIPAIITAISSATGADLTHLTIFAVVLFAGMALLTGFLAIRSFHRRIQEIGE